MCHNCYDTPSRARISDRIAVALFIFCIVVVGIVDIWQTILKYTPQQTCQKETK